ncbi:MAG: DMT family transporter [Planctomycetota bacterium]|jgi:drug/metabolite transporter (DMT)-like permease
MPMIAATIIWAWPMIFVRYVKVNTTPDGSETALFTPHALNFWRYASAALTVTTIALITGRRDFAAVFRRFWVPLVLGVMLATFQMIWVFGVYLVPASYGALVIRVTMIFSLLLSYLFFAEERKVIRSVSFLLSAAVGLGSTACIVLFDDDFSTTGARRDALVAGTLIFLVSSFLWSVYAVTIRKIARKTKALPTFASTVLVATIILAVPAVWEGELGVMWDRNVSGANVQLAVFFSGALCIGITNSLYYQSMKLIGVAYTALVGLAAPFLTGFFAWLVLGERLNTWQWTFGSILVVCLGAMILSSSRGRVRAAPSTQGAPGLAPRDLPDARDQR